MSIQKLLANKYYTSTGEGVTIVLPKGTRIIGKNLIFTDQQRLDINEEDLPVGTIIIENADTIHRKQVSGWTSLRGV